MTPLETAERLSDLVNLIIENVPDIAQTQATRAKSFIQRRIQESGKSSTGNELNAYSISYAKFRRDNDLQTSHVDLTFTGNMWQNTRIVSAEQNGDKYEVTLGGAGTDTQDKINWNSERYGDILQVSEEEEEKLQTGVDEALIKLIKEAGL